jgi:proline iminopeptidase
MAKLRPKKLLLPSSTAPCKSFQEGFLRVSAIHEIWYGQYGNPNGTPVIVLHGGPGAGCDEETVKLFDPEFWRIILLDQRAAKRSKPFAEMNENTTQHLIADIESLRKELHIDKWLVFGGSWGSALAIAYGETYPSHVLGFILRGIFLARKHETQDLWFGMGRIFPDAWQVLNDYIPIEEQHDLINAYYRRVMSPDLDVAITAARAFIKYDFTGSFLNLSAKKLKQSMSDDTLILGLTSVYMHYCVNHFFLKENQLIDNINTVNHLPLIIVHGRYDIITLPKNAYDLHRIWPGSELVFVNSAGHSAKEKQIAVHLAEATEKMKACMK